MHHLINRIAPTMACVTPVVEHWLESVGPLRDRSDNPSHHFDPVSSGRKEGNVLFNDALNAFYLRLYGVRHMVKDHSDSERGNPLLPHGMHHPTDRIAHTTAFVTPVVEHWLEWEIAQWVHSTKDWSDDPSHHERTFLPPVSSVGCM